MKGFSNKDDKIKHGEKIRYGCNATYTLVGNSTQECNDGRWTNSTPSCKGLTVLLPKNCWPSCRVFLKLTSWCCNLRNFLSKKRSQNDFSQLTLWLLSLSPRDLPLSEIPNLRLIFQNNNNNNNNNLNIFIQDCCISFKKKLRSMQVL